MLWALLSVVAGAWMARRLIQLDAGKPGRWVGAFVAGYAASLAVAAFILVIGHGLGEGWRGVDGLTQDLAHGLWIAALGPAAGLAGAWWRGEQSRDGAPRS